MASEHLRVTVEEGVALVVIDRPPVNAMSNQLRRDVVALFGDASSAGVLDGPSVLYVAHVSEQRSYRPTAGNQGRLGALREPLPCWSAFTEGHVTAEGKLSACCFDATANWTMGDLTKQSFMEAWNSPLFVKLREAHLRKDVSGTVCANCIAY